MKTIPAHVWQTLTPKDRLLILLKLQTATWKQHHPQHIRQFTQNLLRQLSRLAALVAIYLIIQYHITTPLQLIAILGAYLSILITAKALITMLLNLTKIS